VLYGATHEDSGLSLDQLDKAEIKAKPAPTPKPETVTGPEPTVIVTKTENRPDTKPEKPEVKKEPRETKVKAGPSIGERMKTFFKDWM